MANENKGKSPADSFGEMMKEFGDAVGKIFDDPDLKKKAKEFGDSAVKSAKSFGERFKDDEVKAKFKDVGAAAKVFGKSMSDYFKDDKEKQEEDSKKKDDLEEKTEKPSIKTEKAGREFERKAEVAGEKADSYFKESRGGRVTGYAFTVFFNALFLIIIYYFNQYIAFYNFEGVEGAGSWERYPLLTPDFERWLPIAVAAAIIAIIGNIILMVYDGYFFRQIILVFIDMFAIASVIILLKIFPFDFSVLPGNDLSNLLTPIITIVLILVAIGIGIAILVKFIKVIVGIAKK